MSDPSDGMDMGIVGEIISTNSGRRDEFKQVFIVKVYMIITYDPYSTLDILVHHERPGNHQFIFDFSQLF